MCRESHQVMLNCWVSVPVSPVDNIGTMYETASVPDTIFRNTNSVTRSRLAPRGKCVPPLSVSVPVVAPVPPLPTTEAVGVSRCVHPPSVDCCLITPDTYVVAPKQIPPSPPAGTKPPANPNTAGNTMLLCGL